MLSIAPVIVHAMIQCEQICEKLLSVTVSVIFIVIKH